jgi:hypothetical protein
MKVYFKDYSAGVDVNVFLARTALDTAAWTNMAQVTSWGSAGLMNFTDTTIAQATVDNSNYAYTVWAGGYWDAANVQIMSALITYTVAEAE